MAYFADQALRYLERALKMNDEQRLGVCALDSPLSPYHFLEHGVVQGRGQQFRDPLHRAAISNKDMEYGSARLQIRF